MDNVQPGVRTASHDLYNPRHGLAKSPRKPYNPPRARIMYSQRKEIRYRTCTNRIASRVSTENLLAARCRPTCRGEKSSLSQICVWVNAATAQRARSPYENMVAQTKSFAWRVGRIQNRRREGKCRSFRQTMRACS